MGIISLQDHGAVTGGAGKLNRAQIKERKMKKAGRDGYDIS